MEFNIKNKLKDKQTVLLLVESGDYNDNIIEVTKELSSGSICYLTLNKTYSSLSEEFKKNKINTDNIFFIDCISKTIKKSPKNSDNCVYCSSPGSLTEISIAIKKFLKQGVDYIIFDSITNLLIYEKKSPVGKFISSLANQIKDTKTRAVFYALAVKEQGDLIKESGMFVDEVIDLGKKK